MASTALAATPHWTWDTASHQEKLVVVAKVTAVALVALVVIAALAVGAVYAGHLALTLVISDGIISLSAKMALWILAAAWAVTALVISAAWLVPGCEDERLCTYTDSNGLDCLKRIGAYVGFPTIAALAAIPVSAFLGMLFTFTYVIFCLAFIAPFQHPPI